MKANSWWGVMGVVVSGTPVACRMALRMAGAGEHVGGSPRALVPKAFPAGSWVLDEHGLEIRMVDRRAQLVVEQVVVERLAVARIEQQLLLQGQTNRLPTGRRASRPSASAGLISVPQSWTFSSRTTRAWQRIDVDLDLGEAAAEAQAFSSSWIQEGRLGRGCARSASSSRAPRWPALQRHQFASVGRADDASTDEVELGDRHVGQLVGVGQDLRAAGYRSGGS